MSDVQRLYAALNASVAASGGTSEGLSRDKVARECGMRAAFMATGARPPTRFPELFYDAKGKPRVIGTRAGTAYHGLQELAYRGNTAFIADIDSKDIEDPAVAAAFVAWSRTGEAPFGTTLDVEVPLEGTVAGFRRTGRADRVIEADDVTIDLWIEYGLISAEPGLYLWDYKLYKSVTHAVREKHERDLQGLLYMYLYEQMTGRRPVGFIYDLTSRADKPTISRLLALVPNTDASLPMLEYYVAQAEAARLAGSSNASACDSQFGACPFINHCPRMGDAKTNQNILDNYKELHQFQNLEDDDA